ncbi:MAG: hydrogenase nickel incorporation protein HypB [Bacteroidales bacterium]
MCTTCGCGETENISFHLHLDHDHQHDHDHHHHHNNDHEHNHTHDHSHQHEHEHVKKISVEQDILLKNQLLAERNRGYFEAKNILALNIISSPGSGKTLLLEKTIHTIKNNPVFVIEGDQQTSNDADRIKNTGTPVIQINTGTGCHLDAQMINHAFKQLEVKENSILFIENIGNLVCPSLFDLGEKFRVVMMSVTEGDDKPEKYPTAFLNAQVCIINKIDLLPYVDFSMEKAKKTALKVNPEIHFFELSAKTNQGMDNWITWLKQGLT